MGTKVVYNACYGGFSLSDEAAAAMGGENRDVCRHDPRLVEVVERLGKTANGRYADLAVAEIKGNRYRIDEYDGYESVQEPDDIDWVVVE